MAFRFHDEYEIPCPNMDCGALIDLKFTTYLDPEKDEGAEEELLFWEGVCPRCNRGIQLMGEVAPRPKVAQA